MTADRLENTDYDLIVIGTGLVESLVARCHGPQRCLQTKWSCQPPDPPPPPLFPTRLAILQHQCPAQRRSEGWQARAASGCRGYVRHTLGGPAS